MSRIREQLERAGSQWAAESGEHLVTTIRDDFLSGQVLNRRTSRLVQSIFSRKRSGPSFEYGTNVKHGIYWEKGWKQPTEIRPVRAKALAWRIGSNSRLATDRKTGLMRRTRGSWIYAFAKRVVLPPQDARPFLQPAGRRETPWMQRLADRLYQGALDKAFPNRVIKIG